MLVVIRQADLQPLDMLGPVNDCPDMVLQKQRCRDMKMATSASFHCF